MMYQAFKNNGNERNTTIAQLQPKMISQRRHVLGVVGAGSLD